MPRRTDNEILEALRESKGMILHAADALGIHESTIHRRKQKSPKFREEYEKINRKQVEKSALKLFDLIDSGDRSAIMFHLRCKGGWTETQDVNLNHSGKITLTVNLPEDMLGDAE